MTPASPDTILCFIRHFEKAQETFLCGMCYWFAYILSGRFGGTMMYEQVENHFVHEIGGRLYDASGDVTERYGSSPYLMRWADMEGYDALLYQRLLRDCVRKDERTQETNGECRIIDAANATAKSEQEPKTTQ